jgi:hypothetical protein
MPPALTKTLMPPALSGVSPSFLESTACASTAIGATRFLRD